MGPRAKAEGKLSQGALSGLGGFFGCIWGGAPGWYMVRRWRLGVGECGECGREGWWVWWGGGRRE
jgi:hypothetical protein